MIVHKILVGDKAGKFLPFALSRLAALKRGNPKGIFIQRFEIEGYFIKVQQLPPFRYIWIISLGETYFEFQTSGYPVDVGSVVVDGVTYPVYNTGVVGVYIKKGVATAKLLGGKRVLYTATASRIARENQVQLLDEPVHYYSATTNSKASQNYSRMLYETYSPFGSHTGVHYHDYHAFFQVLTAHTFLGSATAHFARDVGYDQEWGDNTDFNPMRFASLVGSAADWPRRAGVQLVENDIWGDREFAVFIDAYDQVHVFPTSQIGDRNIVNNVPLQNVPNTYVKMQQIPLPAWVFKKTQRFRDWFAIHSGGTAEEATGLYDFPEHDWKIHPDGTKLCSVVYEREQAVFNSAYFSPFATDIGTQGPGTFYPDATSFAEMNSKTMGVTALHGGALATGDTYYSSAPGLVEADIEITITGPNPEDYSLNVTCTAIRRPTTSSYCTFLAGYVWFDIKATDYTDLAPTYDARRGDLCVLDMECYGRLSDGKAADLYSLKDITRNTEIRTFGGTSVFTSGALFSGIASLVAYNFETLSFVFKYRNEVTTAGTPTKKDLYFGVSVYTNNRYRHTFFPTLMPGAQQTAILSKVDQNDRTVMNSEFGAGMLLMPLNDLRDWTDATMGRLREYYCRSATKAEAETYGAYAGNPQPYANPDIDSKGYKYWKTGAFEFSAPTSDMNNWYNNVVRHGLLKPYVLFDLELPRPGWWQYMGHLTQRIELNPHTTFFTHPNGTWAFFNQSFIFNNNGIHLTPIGDAGGGTGEWDNTQMEHCIFDKVHFVVWEGNTVSTLDSSFRELYNQSIVNGRNDHTLTDASEEVELADMKVNFVTGVIADPYDATVSYAQMRADWPPGFSAYYRELGYFTGTKDFVNGFDAHMIGGALDLSLAALWKQTAPDASNFIYPDQEHKPVTFSTCVLITKV